METAPNDAAFPEGKDDVPGLTKREWFAGMAMNGMLANSAEESALIVTAARSIAFAECLIAALNKGAE